MAFNEDVNISAMIRARLQIMHNAEEKLKVILSSLDRVMKARNKKIPESNP